MQEAFLMVGHFAAPVHEWLGMQRILFRGITMQVALDFLLSTPVLILYAPVPAQNIRRYTTRGLCMQHRC